MKTLLFNNFKKRTLTAFGSQSFCNNTLSMNDAEKIRGGDKEYKPIYEEIEKHSWKNAHLLFDLI